jgi:hypothetical protein
MSLFADFQSSKQTQTPEPPVNTNTPHKKQKRGKLVASAQPITSKKRATQATQPQATQPQATERHALPSNFIQDGYDIRPTQVVPKWTQERIKPISGFKEYMAHGDTFLVGESAKLAWASCLLAMVSGLPLVEHGRAGVNKTGIADAIAKLCPNALKGGMTFSPQKPLGEVFGDMNVNAYTEFGVNVRDLASTALGANIVLLNELDKAEDSIKESLFDYINERVYREAHRVFRFDNRTLVVATVNNPLYSEPLEDRFSINVTLEAPQGHEWWLESRELEDEFHPTSFLTPQIIEEMKERRDDALSFLRSQPVNKANLSNPTNVAEGFALMINTIIKKGIYVSGRKLKHWERVVCSFAAIQGRSTPCIADLWAISLCFFNQKVSKDIRQTIETKLCIVKSYEKEDGETVKSPYPFPVFSTKSTVDDVRKTVGSRVNNL